MMNAMMIRTYFALFCAVLLTACGSAATPAPPTPAPPAPTIAPTATLQPSPTPAPSPTARPTEASTAAPKAVAEGKPATGPGGPCALLKLADIEAAFGTLDAPEERSMDEQFGAEQCAFVLKTGLLSIAQSQSGKAKYTSVVERLKKGGAPLQTLSGFGDEAVLAVGQPSPDVKGSAGVLVLRKGATVSFVTMLSDLDDPQLTSAMRALARKLAAA